MTAPTPSPSDQTFDTPDGPSPQPPVVPPPPPPATLPEPPAWPPKGDAWISPPTDDEDDQNAK